LIFILEALSKYQNKNGALPTSIIVYRDGVGEGQISHFYKTEVSFAFVIVTKRLSARFFAPSIRGPENPRPGTVIDSVVTDPTK